MREIERGVDGERAWRPLRLAGTGLFFAVLAASPLGLLVDGDFRSAVRVPKMVDSVDGVLDGSFAQPVAKLLESRSRFADTVRGHYNETLYRLGLYENRELFVGPNGWLCFAHPLRVTERTLEEGAARRLARYRALRARAARLGVRVLAVPVPDKVRVYSEQFVPEGMSPAHARVYPLILEELRAAGFEALDLATVFATARRERPEVSLFLKWDSHWTIGAMQIAAETIAARLKGLQTTAGWELGPEVAMHFPGAVAIEGVSDLVPLMGFRSAGVPEREPVSGIVARFLETKTWVTAQLVGADGSFEDILPEDPAATVGVCGTSFSGHGLHWALAYYLRRRFDHEGVRTAGGPWAGIESLLDRIEAGESEVKVIVWEFVERFYNEGWFKNLPGQR